MIVISRGLARAVRALARKCVSGRPRGPAPSVVFECKSGTLTAWVRTADAGLVYTTPTRCADELLVVPMGVLDAVEGAGDAPVELAVGPGLQGEARFADRGGPTTHPFDAILPGKQHRPPDPPAAWHPVPAGFLAALHETGRTAARDAGRFALSRVQVKGRAGQVIGTDGRTALVWAGFPLRFAQDVLIPALPVFGSRELTGEREVRVGRTPTHLVVGAGRWRVFLPVDTAGRYPDVAAVIPTDAPTVAGIDAADAARLLDALPQWPGAGDEGRPVTLDLDGGVVVRARDPETGTAEQVRLDGSRASGPRARVAVDRRVLARALALGCHTVRMTQGKPVVFAGPDKTLITTALDPALAAGAGAGSSETPDTTDPERRTAVRHDTTGHPANGRADPPAADLSDPLAEAEGLRAALAEALTRVGRLVAALKHRKKEEKALTRVYAGLRQLRLPPEGQP